LHKIDNMGKYSDPVDQNIYQWRKNNLQLQYHASLWFQNGGKANNIAHVRYVICSNVTYIEGFRLNQLTKTPLRIGASKSCALLTTLEKMSWILFFDSVTRNRYTKTFQNSEYLTTGQKDNS
jgi:hypothetical protein